MFREGKYKLFTNTHKVLEVKARIFLDKHTIFNLIFFKESYLGFFELTWPKKFLDIQFNVKSTQPLYMKKPVPTLIKGFRLNGPLHEEDEKIINIKLNHSDNDNDNIYRLFDDATLQTLKLRQKEA